ncbi:unnamed protein product, partial [Discosporangium mesarthrocarpum]
MLLKGTSERSTSMGLELACGLVEQLGPSPDPPGVFVFTWSQEQEKEKGKKTAGGSTAATGKVRSLCQMLCVPGHTVTPGYNPSRPFRPIPFEPADVDLAGFSQLLIGAMVSCPRADLRSRGHSAFQGLLAHADEDSRFALLKHLILTCPWPNATGLLLDSVRRQLHLALGQFPLPQGGEEKQLATMAEDARGSKAEEVEAGILQGVTKAQPPVGSAFARAPVVNLVCEQLEKVCSSETSSLLDNLDFHTGALALARYAHMADRAHGGPLGLWAPRRLSRNKKLLQ